MFRWQRALFHRSLGSLSRPAPPLCKVPVKGARRPPRWDYVVFMHCVQPPYARLCITMYTVRSAPGMVVQLKTSCPAACPVQSTPAS